MKPSHNVVQPPKESRGYAKPFAPLAQKAAARGRHRVDGIKALLRNEGVTSLHKKQ